MKISKFYKIRIWRALFVDSKVFLIYHHFELINNGVELYDKIRVVFRDIQE